MEIIKTIEKIEELVQNKDAFWLVKHSVTCPISARAFDEYKQYASGNNAVDTYYLTVQDARDVSNYIAEKYEVRHESPQALLFVHNNIVWHASHGQITAASLQQVSEENKL